MTRKMILAGALLAAIPATLSLRSYAEDNATNVMKALMDADSKMMTAMHAAPMTGDADKDFVAMMIPHHQGAIDMAKVELKYGKDPQLRAMAEDIVKAQEKEIAEMQQWQAAHP
jgi:uncharacterized protein (DUF305 family)